MSFQYICESCRQARGLPADRKYLNRIRSKRAAGPEFDFVKRDGDGKPRLLGKQYSDHVQMEPAMCVCNCIARGHDPHVCTGEEHFVVAGRPGSGFVDELATQLGREPIPEQIIGRQAECHAWIMAILGWWLSSSEEDKPAREAELESLKYGQLIRRLWQVLVERRPDLAATEPYVHLQRNLRKLAKYRDKVGHSYPVRGDHFNRIKREKGVEVHIRTTPEELAEYLELSMALQSQLHGIALYLTTEPGTPPVLGRADV